MPHGAKYGVRFIGYAAFVVTRKNGHEAQHAMLDFVTGGVTLNADCGWVHASHREDLQPFLKSLPDRAPDLQQLLRQGTVPALVQALGLDAIGGAATDTITMEFGENSVWLSRKANVNKFIRQLNKRFVEIEQVLEQAEEIGSRITRRPYCDYVNEIGETGLARVEVHGFGLFVDGKLKFHPSPQVLLVRQRELNALEIQENEPSRPPKTRAN